MKYRVFLAFAGLCAATPAAADYGYAKFGATSEAVIAASNGAAIAVAPRPGSEVFGLDLKAEERQDKLTLQFFFAKGSGQLKLVKLVPLNAASCKNLDTEFRASFGTPLKSTHDEIVPGHVTDFTVWRSPQSDDIISFAWFKIRGATDGCHMLMQPPETKV